MYTVHVYEWAIVCVYLNVNIFINENTSYRICSFFLDFIYLFIERKQFATTLVKKASHRETIIIGNKCETCYLKGIKFRDFAIFTLNREIKYQGETFQVYNREIKYPRNLISGGF